MRALARGTRFRRLVGTHFREARGRLAVALLCMLGLTLAELLKPWPLKIVVDQVLGSEPLPEWLGFLQPLLDQGDRTALVGLAGAIVFFALLSGLFAYTQVHLTARIGNEFAYRLRRDLFSHLQRLSLAFHSRARSGSLLTRVGSDTQTLRDAAGESLVTGVAHVLTLVGMLGLMVWLDWHLSLVALATLPVLALNIAFLFRRAKSSARRARKREEGVASRVAESMSMIRLVQSFGRERYESERFDTESAAFVEESIRNARVEAAATRSVELVTAFGTAGVVFLGALRVIDGDLTLGTVLVFLSYQASMYRPLRQLARLSTRFSKASVSMQRVAEVLELDPETADRPDAVVAPPLRGEIRFERVAFAYADGTEVLRDVSFTIHPGERVALVGPSGAGKSTIASMILRLFDPDDGTVRVDGMDIRTLRGESLRDQIAVVLQDSVLFGATIRENIAYGRLEATEEEIRHAARTAGAQEFIERMPQGYDSVVGERGATLSGGQRQRIAIARALVRDPAILILDEPMTGLDPAMSAIVADALERLMDGRTCLVIAHDMDTVARAHRVLRLEDGHVATQSNARSGQVATPHATEPPRGLVTSLIGRTS